MGQGLSKAVEGSLLCEAVVNDDVDVVSQIIQTNPRTVLHKTVVKRRTPLMLASGAGSVECLLKVLWTLERLLDGALYQQHIDQTDSKGNTALLLASKHGHSACVRLLLDDSANPLPANSRGDTALHFAANRGHASCVDLLIHAWVRGHDGTTMRAANTLVSDGFGEERYLNCHNKAGLAALHLAALGGSVESALVLLRNGALPEVPVLRGLQLRVPYLCGGSTPLHIAAFKGNARMCLLLLDTQWRQPGVELCRLRNARGLTPLNCALLAGHHSLARILVESRMQSPLLALSRRALDYQFPEALRQHLLGILRRAQLLVQLREISQQWKDQGLARASDDRVKMVGLAELRPCNIARLEELVRREGSSLRDVITGLEEAFAAPAASADSGTAAQDPDDNAVVAGSTITLQRALVPSNRDRRVTDTDDGTDSGGWDSQGSDDSRSGRRRQRARATRQRGRSIQEDDSGTPARFSTRIPTSSEVNWTLLERPTVLRLSSWGLALSRRRRGRHRSSSRLDDTAVLPQGMLDLQRSPRRTQQPHRRRHHHAIIRRHQTLAELIESAEAALATGAAGIAPQQPPASPADAPVVGHVTIRAPDTPARVNSSSSRIIDPVCTQSSIDDEGNRMRDSETGVSAAGHASAAKQEFNLDPASHCNTDEVECTICFDGVSDVEMVPCRHGMCFVCACKMVARTQDPQCPFCRGNIHEFTLRAGARVHSD